VVFCALAVSDTSRCARICEKAVPFAALLFILTSAALLLLSPLKTLNALADIFKDAFSVKACAGGTFGWFFTKVCVNGLRRGAFSHEAGLGSTCAVHSSCEDISAQMQGKLAMSEVFIDTMVICTVTALVIIVSGADFSHSDYTLTVSNAYSVFLGSAGGLFVSLCLTLFSLCTLTGWFFIGESSFACLFPEKTVIYKLIYLLCAYLGSQFPMQTVWELSDIFNALMALPNIVCVLMLSKQVSAPKFRRLRGG
jgi:AGCS family alanine or glycine:cation symporter